MRTFIIIITLLMQGVQLFASQGGASSLPGNSFTDNSGEIIASWESRSDSILMGGRVIDDFKHAKSAGLPLSSLCSAESIEKIYILRKLTSDIISGSGCAFSETYTAAAILKKLAAVAFTPLTEKENDIISSAENLFVSIETFQGGGFCSNGTAQPEIGISLPLIIITFSPAVKCRISAGKKNLNNPSIRVITCLSERFDMEFADFYRLFFYVRDNSGNGKAFHSAYNNRSIRISRSFRHSIQYKTSDKINNIIPRGASS